MYGLCQVPLLFMKIDVVFSIETLQVLTKLPPRRHKSNFSHNKVLTVMVVTLSKKTMILTVMVPMV